MSNVRPRQTRRMPACVCAHPSLLCGPSVKLGRRTSAALQPARLVRLGRLPVFAVSEPSTRLTQEGLARSGRSSRYRAAGIEHSSTGIAELPMRWRYRAYRALFRGCSNSSLRLAKSSSSARTSSTYPPVLRTGSNTSAHAGYGVGLCTLQGCHATEPSSRVRSVCGHNGAVTIVQVASPFQSSSRVSAAWPNPSIEGTSTSGLRPLAAAPHVKR